MKPSARTKHAVHRPRLFGEPERPANLHTAQIDGAARGNPGPASYAVIIRRPDGSLLKEIGKYIGRATNNVAEYYALIAALDFASAQGIAHLRVLSDSELLVRQMQGLYKVKNADLRPLFERAKKLTAGLAYFAIEHVRRELNRDADRLANEALDRTSSHSRIQGIERSGAPASSSEPRKSTPKPRSATRADALRVRAHYKSGAFHPVEPLDLPEGAEVDLTVLPHRT
ncbi:MAG: reverse transcriptase-like protein [Acidobacteria bacterium]|nr:reverse transcriptase-like protein [Acidobacteriota bacterium]MCL5289177.1 reverse transcriptase-like protein [Acidobacteriota bacterium]